MVRWAPRAAQRAASSGAHREAAAQYARALRFADGLSLETRVELLQRRADECYITAQFAEAIEAQQGALDLQRQLGDQRGQGNSLRSLSRLLFFAGRVAEGEPMALEAVGLVRPHALPQGVDQERRQELETLAVADKPRVEAFHRHIDTALHHALTELQPAQVAL